MHPAEWVTLHNIWACLFRRCTCGLLIDIYGIHEAHLNTFVWWTDSVSFFPFMVFMLWQRLDPRQVFCSYLVILLCSLSDHQQMYMYPYVSLSCAQEQSSAEGGRRGGWPSQTPARGNWPQPWDQTCQTWPCWHGWRRWAQHSFLMEALARQYHMVISQHPLAEALRWLCP